MSEANELPEIEVFTQKHCAGCKEVEQFLRARAVTFTVRDVAADPAALAELTSRGYMSTPVTRIGTHWVAGFKRSQIETLLRTLRDARGMVTDEA